MLLWTLGGAVCCILSILYGLQAQVDQELVLYLTLISTLVLGFTILVRHYIMAGLSLMVIVGLLLTMRASSVQPPPSFSAENLIGTQAIIAVVDNSPQPGLNSTQVVLKSVELPDQPASWHGKIVATMPRHTQLSYGDKVQLDGELESTASIKDQGYRQYLENHQIYGVVYWPDLIKLESGFGNPLIALGYQIQDSANSQFQKILPKDASAFLSGVVLGSKQEISEEFEQDLKDTGTTHIIVASGYNISIVIMVATIITRKLKKITSSLLTIITVACYLLVSGLDPSIVRASLMAVLVVWATLLGRQKESLYFLLLTAIIMLYINPWWLLDISFQLSFLATFGIVSLQPFIESKLSNLPKWLSEVGSTTLAAQIFVYPIIAVTFGEISLVSLLTNILILWATPILMFGGAILLIASYISISIGSLLAFVIYPVFAYIKTAIHLSAQMPFAKVNMEIGWGAAFAYYLIIFALYQLRVSREDSYA